MTLKELLYLRIGFRLRDAELRRYQPKVPYKEFTPPCGGRTRMWQWRYFEMYYWTGEMA